MGQKTKLTLRIFVVMIALLTIGMQLQFIMTPGAKVHKFWVLVGSFILLLITGQ
jgi:hypothetical protein